MGFIFGLSFLVFVLISFSAIKKPPMESLFLARDQPLSLWSRSTNSKTLDYQSTPNPREYQIENSHKGNHLNTRPSITQLAVAPCAGCLIQTTDKTKTQTKSSAERITTSLSPTCKRGKKNSTNLTLYEAYTKLDQT